MNQREMDLIYAGMVIASYQIGKRPISGAIIGKALAKEMLNKIKSKTIQKYVKDLMVE